MLKPANSIKINRLQIGEDAPAVAAGEVSIKNKSFTNTTKVSGWGASTKAQVISTGAAFYGTDAEAEVLQNLYFDGTNYKRVATGAASLYRQETGTHKWYTAASSSAGNTATLGLAFSIALNGVATAYFGISTDTIVEKTSAAGVTIDSLLIKDAGIRFASNAITAGVMTGNWNMSSGNLSNLGNVGATTVTATTLTDGTASLSNGVVTGIVSLNGITATELTQINNINSTTISAAQWGYLGVLNQNLRTTDNVTFGNVAGTLTTAAQTNITSLGTLISLAVTGNITVGGTVDGVDVAALFSAVGTNTTNIGTNTTNIGTNGTSITNLWADLNGFPDELKNLVAAEINQLANIGSSTISSTQWGYVGNLNQNLRTTDAVNFGTLKVGTSGATINTITTLGTLSGNVDTSVPTEKAVKTYADGITTKTLTFENKTISASSNTISNLVLSNFASAVILTNVTGASNANLMTALAVKTYVDNATPTDPVFNSATVTYQYFGDSATDGSYRMSVDGSDLLIERRESSAWVVKSTIVG